MTLYVSPVADGTDFGVPQFEVKLQGRKVDPMVINDVLEVSYHDNLTDIDAFEFTLGNWDASERTYRDLSSRAYKYSDGDTFLPGQKVALSLGYRHGGLELMIQGEITSLTPSFPAAGFPTLRVGGLNVLHRLRTKQRSHAYVDMTDGQIAQQIADKLGMRLSRDP